MFKSENGRERVKHTSKICTIARYGYAKRTWTVHYIYNIEHSNLETRKTLDDFFFQVRHFLLPLSLKVFRHKERETQSFYSSFFICPPPQHVRPPSQMSPQASKNQPSSPEAGLISTLLTDFFKISQNPPRASGA